MPLWPVGSTMVGGGLTVRHAHTESVVPEYHHAVNRFVRVLFWYIVVGVVILFSARRFVVFSRRHWRFVELVS